jgi:DNA polymerase-3 subunit gamma/tau
MASIYRKYRPQTFAEMVGQQHIKLTLQNELESGNFVHAYLFCGPRGLGKTTLARLFAKSINCEKRKKGESEPCNKCEACQDITVGKSMDVIEIDAASHTGVDNVRENIVENARFAPSKRKYKVFIIDEVHMLSISAFNALLKTLEEPPSHTVFILCTTEIHKVPETIISRCQRFDLKKVPADEMIKRLARITKAEKVKIEKEVFEIIANKSEGCMRDAESLLGQVLSLGSGKITLDDIKTILPSSEIGLVLQLLSLIATDKPGEAIDYLNQLVEDGVDLEIFGKEFIELLRKLILIKIEARKTEWFDLPNKVVKQVEEILSYVNVIKLAQLARAFSQALVEIKNSPMVQLPFELVIIELYEANNQPINKNFDFSDKFKGGRVQTVKELNIKTQEQRDLLKYENLKTKEITEKKEEITQSKSTHKINLKDIKKRWRKIIEVAHTKGTDLMFINEKMVWPVETRGNKLVVGFQYDLYKSRFETNGNSELFAQVVKEVANQEVIIEAKTLKPSERVEFEMEAENQANQDLQMSGAQVTEDNILDQVLENFGGEVVEN